MDGNGPVLLLLLAWVVCIGTVVFNPLALCSIALLGSTSSYFITRSHPNNICNLMPLIVMALLGILNSRAERNQPRPAELLLVSLFCVTLVLTLGNAEKFASYFESITQARVSQKLEKPFGAPPPEIQELLMLAHAKEDEPALLLYNTLLPTPLPAGFRENWLPAAPAAQIGILPSERQKIYFERFLKRKRIPGWLIYPLSWDLISADAFSSEQHRLPSPVWITHVLKESHSIKSEFVGKGLKIVRFEPLF